MDDALLVRRFERVGNRFGDGQRLVQRKRTLREAIGKRRALDELLDERVDAARFLEAVNRRDIRMIERREELRFAPEPRNTVAIQRERFRQYFQGDVAIERRVSRAIDLAHAARAEWPGDFVRSKPSPGR